MPGRDVQIIVLSQPRRLNLSELHAALGRLHRQPTNPRLGQMLARQAAAIASAAQRGNQPLMAQIAQGLALFAAGLPTPPSIRQLAVVTLHVEALSAVQRGDAAQGPVTAAALEQATAKCRPPG